MPKGNSTKPRPDSGSGPVNPDAYLLLGVINQAVADIVAIKRYPEVSYPRLKRELFVNWYDAMWYMTIDGYDRDVSLLGYDSEELWPTDLSHDDGFFCGCLRAFNTCLSATVDMMKDDIAALGVHDG